MTLSVIQGRSTSSRTRQDEVPIVAFIEELMRRRNRVPTQMAADLGVSHPTVFRWLAGADLPSTASCRKLARYSGVPVQKVLAMAGHLPQVKQTVPVEWPEFREYALQKYPYELDEDLVDSIEELIERRRSRRQQ
jgi:transcriptional regulator with XRE-family HTH domain